MLYDLIIAGAGPAGITAAVYAARQIMKFLVISKDIGGQAAVSYDIENYTGYQFIKGPELAEKFEQHLKQFAVELKQGEEVKSVEKSGDVFKVSISGEEFEARAVIIASGRKPRLLNIPGEQEFKGRGVTYCATCDGPLFKGKDVAVIGGGNSAMGAAIQLLNIANRVHIINLNDGLTGDVMMINKLKASDKLEIHNNTATKKITGDKLVSGLELESGGKFQTLEVQGVFVEIGSVPENDFVNGVKKNEAGEIIVNCRNETNVPGLFAAGDVTDVPEKQIIIAAGEGSKACLGAFRYISRGK